LTKSRAAHGALVAVPPPMICGVTPGSLGGGTTGPAVAAGAAVTRASAAPTTTMADLRNFIFGFSILRSTDRGRGESGTTGYHPRSDDHRSR
jgi:hypothetical protein